MCSSETIRARDLKPSGITLIYINYIHFLEFWKSEVIDLRYDRKMTSERSFLAIFCTFLDWLLKFSIFWLLFDISRPKELKMRSLTSRRFIKWPLTSCQRSKIKFIILPCRMSRYMLFGSRNSKIALFFKNDLSEVTQWPLTTCQRSKIKFIILPCCMSRYMFFGSMNSKIALLFYNDLS